MQQNEKVIPLSRWKMFQILAGLVVVLAMNCYLLYCGFSKQASVVDNLTGRNVFLFATIGLWVFGIWFFAKKMLDRNAGLIVNSDGIHDNSSGVSAGFVPWSDIQKITLEEFNGQKCMMVYVNNPDDYVSREQSATKRKAMQGNHKLYGTPVTIPGTILNMKITEINEIVQSGLEAYRSGQRINR